ncbi:MAG: ABC transporter ATP-binding protein [Intrasporangium sp.]|uniref:ABC transporter ATP-binding protein n=1 Tax=Intrasporangium sp. TaxID=1925024 RepID=UPI003F7EFDE2
MTISTSVTPDARATVGDALLRIESLTKHFPIRRGLLQRQVGAVQAVDGLTFDVARGETLSLVGESGCGKTTTGRMLTRLIEPTAGSIVFDGRDITHLSVGGMRPLRRDVQLIFQDPYSSLNPRHTVGKIVGAPFRLQQVKTEHGVKRATQDLLELVGLSPEHYNRYPHEFSGGQRQRIGIARSLALRPKLIVADEPVSALDVSVQAQILNLLADLRADLGVSVLFITHDLSVVEHLCRRTAVMYLGRLTEVAPTETFFAAPQHHYSVALRDAIPRPDPTQRLDHVPLRGEIPSPLSPPSGCRFHPRCPAALPICSSQDPPLEPQAPDHLVACWNPVRATAPTTPRETTPDTTRPAP